MGMIDDLLAHNEGYAAGYSGAGLSPQPVKKVAVVACMDARLDVHGALGLEPGDAHVIRNAGGIITDDVIRSLMISQRVLGTGPVILIHHTDCGLGNMTDDEIRTLVEQRTGVRPTFDIGSFKSAEESIRRSIDKLQATPFVLDHEIRGFIFDTETGRLNPVH